jgi:NADPH-dependent 2,4-dienoyl-CoA reductase/sulfur reductase-like enzyme
VSDTAPTILIVGGVAGGASAAARARRMNENARIIIFERDSYVSFANCGLPYYLGGEITDREALLIAKPSLFKRRFDIDVRTRHEVTAIDREVRSVTVMDLDAEASYEMVYDKLILAPGADPIEPPIPGVNAEGGKTPGISLAAGRSLLIPSFPIPRTPPSPDRCCRGRFRRGFPHKG